MNTKPEVGDEIIITGFNNNRDKHAEEIKRLFMGRVYTVSEVSAHANSIALLVELNEEVYEFLTKYGLAGGLLPPGSEQVFWFHNIDFRYPDYDLSKANSLCRR